MNTEILADDWDGFEIGKRDDILKPTDTSYALKKLNTLAKGITQLPEGKKIPQENRTHNRRSSKNVLRE